MPSPSQKTYSRKFPERIYVIIEPAKEGGFVAWVRDFPGCITQADNYWELVEMINDAIRTWLEIPAKYHKGLPFYIPPSPFIENPIKQRGQQRRLFISRIPA